MEDAFADAVRAVVNFSRNDARYAALGKSPRKQLAYFEDRFVEIAAEHSVDPQELRSYLGDGIGGM